MSDLQPGATVAPRPHWCILTSPRGAGPVEAWSELPERWRVLP